MKTLKEQINDYMELKPHTYSQAVMKDIELMEKIKQATPLLPDNVSLKTRIYWILNDLTEPPKCHYCGKEFIMNIYTLKDPFRSDLPCCQNPVCRKMMSKERRIKHCEEKYGKGITDPMQVKDIKDKIKQTNLKRYGTTVAINCKEIQDKIRQASLEKYGVENPAMRPDVVEKRKQTCLKRYGSETPLGNKDVQNKIKQTNLEKYGSESPFGNEEIIEKIKETCLEKYGKTSYTQTEEYKEKNKATCLEKYGVEHHLMSKEIQDKIHDSVLGKYGVDNVFQDESVKEKIKETCLEKYGTSNASQNEQVREKTRLTNLEKYGAESPFESKEIQDKIKKTILEKYGVENVFQNEEIKKQIKETMLTKYGVEYAGQTEKSRISLHNRNYETAYEKILVQLDKPMFTLEEFMNSTDKMLTFKCHKCGEPYQAHHVNGKHHPCLKCFPISGFGGTSISEMEIKDFLEGLLDQPEDLIQHDRKLIAPLEVDFNIPSRKLAIEFDGLYWHCEANGKDRNYHLNKTILCEKQDFKLIHIFENEWKMKQKIVKSRLMAAFGKLKRIPARKCLVKEIPFEQAALFLDENHIQGSIPSSINIGLEFEGELVVVMTFNKPRFNKKYEWELLRFANKCESTVVGGAAKLLKYFEKTYNPKSLLSYADRRWSNVKSNIYQNLGFTLVSESEPNYWYFLNDFNLYNRMTFQKHKLKNALEKFDPSKSEVQNMMENGYNRIFDCGNLVFFKKY